MTRVFARKRSKRLNSFSLVELLVVMFIIAILAALVLFAGEGVMKTAARSRAKTEIQSMTAGLESYKTDNGAYPASYFSGGTNSYASSDGSASTGPYQLGSQILYQALSGKTNYTDAPVAGIKYYVTFKPNQLGNTTAGGAYTYIEDPFGYSYGYNTGTTTDVPYMGQGFFDLWSGGGALVSTANATNSWISNWALPQ